MCVSLHVVFFEFGRIQKFGRGVRLIFCGVVGDDTFKERQRPLLLSLSLGLKMAVNSGT